jgi:hypothetical protein
LAIVKQLSLETAKVEVRALRGLIAQRPLEHVLGIIAMELMFSQRKSVNP